MRFLAVARRLLDHGEKPGTDILVLSGRKNITRID